LLKPAATSSATEPAGTTHDMVLTVCITRQGVQNEPYMRRLYQWSRQGGEVPPGW
jgi:hypothetical protein